MPSAKQQSWKINVNAKFKNSHFKFKAKDTNPTCKSLKFSLFLKLHRFLFRLKSDSGLSIPSSQQNVSLKSKFLKFFRKFKIIPSRKQPISAKKKLFLKNPENKTPSNSLKMSEGPICIESLFTGTLTLFSKAIRENDKKGMIIHGLSILSLTALFFKNYVTMKAKTLMVFLTTALVIVFAVMFNLHKCNYTFTGLMKMTMSPILFGRHGIILPLLGHCTCFFR
ncbi:uncharacterized protein LOC126664784 isoform X2 [Mercurialis annua]|nr:uncharacterized protein LOC126664784 isoform X2 [Mercurialis annua]